MDTTERQLKAYYEAEAHGRKRPAQNDDRRRRCERFARHVRDHGGRSVLDVGAGPASDHRPFGAHGIGYVGIDLAIGNAAIAASLEQVVVPASLFELPFRDDSFDAGWSMSTLQHIDDGRFDDAMSEIVRVLRPGAPVEFGIWGGREEIIDATSSATGIDLPRRFVLRDHERICALLAAHVDIEHDESFRTGTSDWEYSVTRARTPSRPRSPVA